jgi:hypothetical protein
LKHRRIGLNPDEYKVIDIVLQVIRYYRLTTTPRIAGGWVRNKVCVRV